MEAQQTMAVLAEAVRDLYSAAIEMAKSTIPRTPMPRIRRFAITERMSWPYTDSQGTPDVEKVLVEGRGFMSLRSEDVAREVFYECEGQPKKILRALRRIQAATVWCRARAEGRRRMAEEILKQQKRAVEVLEAEIAISALKK